MFQRAADSLPEPDPGSMINYFLAVSLQENDPPAALILLRAFANARAWKNEENGRLDREVRRRMALLELKR